MLDKSRDFGTIKGEGNAKYYQDGRYYDASENEVLESGELILTTPDPAPPSVMDETVVDDPDVVADVDDAPPVGDPENVEDGLEDLPYQEVKKRVEAAGGVWTNKVEGINYLRGL